jgi:hypothetical protein
VQRSLKCADALEPGTNVFSTAAALIEGLRVPTTIPEDIFRDTWAMHPKIALYIATLESRLANYATVTAQPGLSSISVIPQPDRTKQIDLIRIMLAEIDTLQLKISNYCEGIVEKTALPFWRRWVGLILESRAYD